MRRCDLFWYWVNNGKDGFKGDIFFSVVIDFIVWILLEVDRGMEWNGLNLYLKIFNKIVLIDWDIVFDLSY